LLPKLLWTGDEEGLDLVGGLASGFDRARPSDAERPDRLHSTVASLRHDGGVAGERGSGSGVGVERVGLALGASSPAVRPVDLDDDHVCSAQVSSEGNAVGAGALYANPVERAEAT
jgi:hypothetical protein